MSEIKTAAIVNYIHLFVTLGIGLFVSPFILSCLGTSEYGVYTLAATVISWLTMCDFGLTASTTKFICEYHARNDAEGEAHYLGNITALFTIIGLIVLIVGLIIYPFLDQFFPKLTSNELSLLQILYLMALINTAVIFPSRSLGGISESRQKFLIPRIVVTISALISSVTTVILLSFGFKSIALSAVTISMSILSMLWNIYYCFGVLKARMRWNGWDLKLCRSMFAFSLWMFLGHVITLLNWGCGNMIIGMTRGAADVSVYSYGLQLMNFYFLASSCISNLFLPRIVKVVATSNDSEVLTDMWIRVGRIHVIILGLLLSGVFIFGKQFMSLWVGHTLGKQSDTSWIVAILLVSGVTLPLIQCLGWQIMQARNVMHLRVKALLIVAGLNFVIGYILSIHYGAIGLAIGTAASLIIGQGIVLNVLYKCKVGLNVLRFFKETFSSIGGGVILAVLAFIVMNYFENLSWMSFVVLVAVYTFIYYLVILNTYMNKDECDMVPSVLQCFKFTHHKT